MKLFRAAAPASSGKNLLKTALMTSVFWLVFVAGLPALILELEAHFGLPSFDLPARELLAFAVFICMGALNLWSGYTMATLGRGTPLPVDMPNELVVAGPYAYVRNPMAIGGLGAGAGVGLYFGSWAILAYVMAGGLIWHVAVRPFEERDLEERFGDAYRDYRGALWCWVPRSRYRADSVRPSSD